MNSNRKLVVVAIILTMVLGAGGTARAITNGQPDGSLHPYVAAISMAPLYPSYVCSGVAISPTVVVTAAHCRDMIPGNQVQLTFDSPWNAPTANWHWGTIYAHPDFCLGCQPGLPGYDTHDIAVVVLDVPVTLSAYAVLPAPGLVDTLPMKAELTIVGYGIHGWQRGGGNPFDYGKNLDWTRYYAVTDFVASKNAQSGEYLKLTANPAQGKGGDCFFDSGGPVLLGNVVLGITSYLPNINCTGVTYSNRIDLAYALDFIGSF